jgi:hypothetical protein
MANVSKRTAHHLDLLHDELERLRAYVRELEKDKVAFNEYLKEHANPWIDHYAEYRELIDNAKEGQ